MRNRTLFLMCAAAALIPGLVAAEGPRFNGQKIFAWGSPEHEALQWLAVETGQAMPSGTGPFSAAELRMELSRIDAGRLSPAGRERRAWLQDRLSIEREVQDANRVFDNFAFASGFELNLEGYVDISDDVEAWEYAPRRRLPFVSIPLEAWAGEHLYGTIDIDLRKFPPAPGGYNTSEPDPFTNAIVTDINSLDIEFPSRAFLSLGGDFWNLQFGRDDVSWGNGYTGNLYLADSVREYDFARVTGFWRFFKFSTIWISLDGRLSPSETSALNEGQETVTVDVDANGNVVATGSGVETKTIVINNTSKYADIRDLHRSFLAHRFEIRLWDRLNLIATEGIMYGGDDMELRFLNPMMLYHNQYTNPLPGNVHMSYEIEYTPAPGWMVYAQLSPDQWSSPLEGGSYTANEPNALGYLAGVRWQQPLERGFVRTVAEAALLDPWMYIHIRGHSSISYRDLLAAESFTTSGNPSSRAWVEGPLGYYTGNDSAVMFLESRYVEPGDWFAGLRARAEVRGERDMSDTLPETGNETDLTEAQNGATTPSGAHAEWTTFLTAFGEVQRPRRNGSLVLGGELTWATLTNEGNQDTSTAHDLQLAVYTRLIW